ncbi:MAG TPA: CRTAC1 family protein [Bryobacteraceae bacterium]|nr:ASPIC/UnbV domain protein [Candidatus Sulfopaludibacter sp. SbA4]HYW44605.1 CRTAC1 family protein [Bryobacteraceae bacterium]
MTRRQALSLPLGALALTGAARGQNRGMASRGVAATPRGTPSGRPFHARFVNVAASAGLRAPVIYGSPGRTDYILESMGCGAAFLDYDNDGWLDILVLTGRRLQSTPDGAIIRLYRNNRDGTFTDVSEKSGLARSVWASGITVGDYDNDGFDDVFITCWGQNLLFHNNGNGTFTDVTEKAGLIHPGTRYGTGCTWIDYDRDGRLDLFVSHYNVFDLAKVPARGKDPGCNYNGVPIFCGPAGLPQESCRLYHNNGDGTFSDVSAKSGISSVKAGYALTAAAADFDGDGWPDIYVACDTSPSLLFRNHHDGTFTEEGLERGVSLSEDGQEQAGMGLGIGDFDGDGYVDIFKTHFRGDTGVLYRNNGKGYFRDMTLRAGLGVETRFVCWGAAIADLDNDGLPDIFFSTGMVYPEVEQRIPDAPYKTPNVVFRNLGGGKFEELLQEAGPGIAEAHSSRGTAFGDFDNDGDIDILVMNMNEPPSLLRNDVSGTDHWLKVLLVGTASNRSAIGAQVVVSYGERKQAQAVLAQSSYLSVNDRRLHFGLGSATTASVEIRWPNGGHENVAEVAADRLVVIREGSGVVRTERFGKGGLV